VGVALGQSVFHMDSSIDIGGKMRADFQSSVFVHFYLLLLQQAVLAMSLFGNEDLSHLEVAWHTAVLFGTGSSTCKSPDDANKIRYHITKVIEISYTTLRTDNELSGSFLAADLERQLHHITNLMSSSTDTVGFLAAFTNRSTEFALYSKGRRNLGIKGYAIRSVARSIENKFKPFGLVFGN
jgi:hypothetical protein